jgi:hypothetical protein
MKLKSWIREVEIVNSWIPYDKYGNSQSQNCEFMKIKSEIQEVEMPPPVFIYFVFIQMTTFVFLFVQFAYVLHVSVGLPGTMQTQTLRKSEKSRLYIHEIFYPTTTWKSWKSCYNRVKSDLYIKAWYKVPLSINLQVILCKKYLYNMTKAGQWHLWCTM